MPLPADATRVLDFWTEIGPQGWYEGGEALDMQIRRGFLDLWQQALNGQLSGWLVNGQGHLALILLTDQLSRNMHRGDAQAFATDTLARRVAKRAVRFKHDLSVEGPMRQFFYMPFMHSETTIDQDRCVCLFAARMPGDGPNSGNLLHARAHREIIRQFGRFPYRNAALGRTSTDAERDFLENGGYGAIVRDLSAQG